MTLTRSADGGQGVTIEPAASREGVGFLQQRENNQLYVIPTDVADLVPGVLDRELFDVTGLVDAGYHESHRDSVPVIVQASASGDAPAQGARATSAPEPDWAAVGIEPERTLESVDAVATDLDRGAAADLLASLRAPSGARAAADAPTDLKVWLDAPVQALDADSSPQVGAPQAWDAGYTGEGVTVAVLDTGVDTTHPDLDDVVIGSKDFSGSGSTADGYGHGTHVASIALGSGDASDGVNRGVAPGADLLVGKVLDDGGFGEMSWVIDGMEWAAGEGADVVNLSLGQPGNYSDGTDPASLAVNALSAEHGTLFVISAGNESEYGTVTTPGSADAALTVGAVDDDDAVTWFSSRGPRGGDEAIKPDVTAPGNAIVAARAAGTEMDEIVDEYHVLGTGTSMAAPHVAGAAAVLKQARPELTGQELKSILMGSAQPTSGTVWDEGAGRIFLPTALEQRVVASPSALSFGIFEFPQSGSDERTLTYENPTDADVTLGLTLAVTGPDGAPAPDGAAGLSDTTMTVPAHGSATVDVTVDRTAGAVGRYSGAVTATASGGGEIRTALGWHQEPELYDLTIVGLGRDGAAFDGEAEVVVFNVDDGRVYSEFVDLENGRRTLRVPVGTYSVTGNLWEQDAEGAITELTLAAEPELDVVEDTTVVLDASAAEKVSVTTGRVADREQVYLSADRTDAPNGLVSGVSAYVPGGADVYATRTEPVSVGGFDFTTGFALAAPTAAGSTPAYTYDLAYVQDAVRDVSFAATSDNTAKVAVRYADLGPGSDLSHSWTAEQPDKWWTFRPGYDRSVVGGTTGTAYLSAGDYLWSSTLGFLPEDSTALYFFGDGRTYAPGEAKKLTIGGAVLNTRISQQDLFATRGDVLSVAPRPWSDGAGHRIVSFDAPAHLRVWQDGTQVADAREDLWADVPIPAGGADYRVALDAERDVSWWNRSTRVSTEWEFRAEPGGSLEEPADLPLLYAAFGVAGVDVANTAPARTRVTLTVAHQAGTTGGRITQARLWWSPDDGDTWRRATLHRTGAGVYTTDVRVPRGTEHVSLRVEAKDKAGTTIKQTVIRAYGIR